MKQSIREKLESLDELDRILASAEATRDMDDGTRALAARLFGRFEETKDGANS